MKLTIMPLRLPGILALAFVFVPASRAETQQNVPRYERGACEIRLPLGIPQDISRECGQLIVPEVRGRSNGRTYRLAVVIYRAKEPDGSPPLLLLHGGPAGYGGTRFPWREMQFPLTRKRDVVVFDMRGSGLSEPAICPDFAERAAPAFLRPTRREWEAGLREAVRECVAQIDAQGFDPTSMSLEANAADAIDLRRSLGYQKWDIYGVSYGGIVAQELLRVDPQSIRAAALISATTVGPAYHSQVALSHQRMLERVAASCAAQPACHSAFPTVEPDFYALYADLSAQPVTVEVQVASPVQSVVLNGERFLMHMREHFNRPGTIARIPALLHEMRRGHRGAALQLLVGDGVISPWGTVGRIIQCNEYGASYRAAVAATKSALRPEFHAVADDFREHCDQWVPNLNHQSDTLPVACDVPTLVLHGEYDPMDVKSMQQGITAKLSRAYTYVVTGETHANSPVGCHGSIVQQFLENPMRAPDRSCIAGLPGIRFETSGVLPTVTFLITAAANTRSPFAGKWEAALGGGLNWTVEIEVDGAAARGRVGGLAPMKDGRIEGSTLSFKVNSTDGTRTITFTGKLQGEHLSFTRTVEVLPGGDPGVPGLLGGSRLRAFTARRIQ